ncbi:U6 snRNA phosphodiesterase 1-like [Diadema setosum]|uniref:U6 snRNA phosphodiesterase 1-like n=1 Tax=Diadema setosum TaxID=31175 RepID=UPI003B3B785F
MAGLKALRSYESESSSNDDDSEHGVIHHQIKKRKLNDSSKTAGIPQPTLELPPEILSMFGSSRHPAEASDPSNHRGRIRSFDHVPGNWATYIYIPAESSNLRNLAELLMTHLPKGTTFEPSDDLHISLSRTVCLQYHWIEPFTKSLSGLIAATRSFKCHLERVDIYTNDEKTRTFLGLKVGAGHDTLCDLVALSDECLSEFSLPCFYKNPSFHISFCWCVGDVSAKFDAASLRSLQDKLLSYDGSLTVDAREIHCKSGCKKFVFPLG